MPRLSRCLWETMLEPLRLPLPSGMRYHRRLRFPPLRIIDSRPLSEDGTPPNPTIREATRILPSLEDKLVHPFPKLVCHILRRLLATERDFIYHVLPGEDEFEWSADKEEESDAYQENEPPSNRKKQDDYHKALFLKYPLDEVALILINDMFGFGLDGSLHATPRVSGTRGLPAYGFDDLVELALLEAYPIYFRESIGSDEKYAQALRENREIQRQMSKEAKAAYFRK